MNIKTPDILAGVGSFLLGVPFGLFPLAALGVAGANIISVGIILASYIIVCWVLGKLNPALGWKSGFFFALGIVSVAIWLGSRGRIVDIINAPLVWTVILVLIVFLCSWISRIGSRGKTGQSKFPLIIFWFLALLLILYTVVFMLKGINNANNPQFHTPTAPVAAPAVR